VIFCEKDIQKIAVFSMVGMMQIGFGVSAIEATPLFSEDQQHIVKLDDRHDQYRRERERSENERHEREMRRREHESEREWRERQRRENERHDENIRRIAHDILDLILDK